VKPELRAWALGGPIAAQEPPRKPAKSVVYAFSPAPIEIFLEPTAPAAAETIATEDVTMGSASAETEQLESASESVLDNASGEAVTNEPDEVEAIVAASETVVAFPIDPERVDASLFGVQIEANDYVEETEPADVQETPAMDAASLPEEQVPSILILDREESLRKLLRRILERQGYKVRDLGNSLDLTSELLPEDVDLLITDPEEQPDAVETMHDIYPEMRIIVLSNSWEGELGTCAVLQKPFRTEVLLESVRSALS